MYRRQRELPRSLVLASAYAGWAGSLPAEVVAECVRRVLDETDRPPEEWVSSYLPGFFAGPVDQAILEETTEIMCAARPAGVKPMVAAFAEANLRGVLGSIAVPTLLIYGELDERAPLAVARDLHARIPASTLKVMPGVGHCTNLETPQVFNDIVRRFLTPYRTMRPAVDVAPWACPSACEDPTRDDEPSAPVMVDS